MLFIVSILIFMSSRFLSGSLLRNEALTLDDYPGSGQRFVESYLGMISKEASISTSERCGIKQNLSSASAGWSDRQVREVYPSVSQGKLKTA
jgi:hypothetical protein